MTLYPQTTAFVFPGQGSQAVGMGKDLSEGYAIAQETFEEADPIARAEITPISDVRGSRDFRLQLAGNVLRKFYFDARST